MKPKNCLIKRFKRLRCYNKTRIFRFVMGSDPHQPNWLAQTMVQYIRKMNTIDLKRKGIKGILMKPIVMPVMANMVRKILDENADHHEQNRCSGSQFMVYSH